MKVLLISSEVAPFSRSGGLGDVCGALPKALRSIGHEVRIVTPKYRDVSERRYNLREVARLKSLDIHIGGHTFPCSVKSGFIPRPRIQVYFIDNKDFFDRNHYYVDPQTGKDWEDNHLRFAFLVHATLQLVQHLNWIPDIIHCNDWQTALLPYLIRTDHRYYSVFRNTRTVLHIHNASFLGLFNYQNINELCLNPEDAAPCGPLEFYGKLSFLKAGAYSADRLLTVSPTYAREIQATPDWGGGLEGLYTTRKDKLIGVLNGVDTQVWNPEKDCFITTHYNIENLNDGKTANKNDLLQKMWQSNSDDTALIETLADFDEPIICMITRLTEQKGIDLLMSCYQELSGLPIKWIFLAKGDAKYERFLSDWARLCPEKVKFIPEFNDQLAHFILAGSDFLLMPSLFEPCGLNQLYAFSYGTIPIVRHTGGLADTVIDYNGQPETGNGFSFQEFTSLAMIEAIKRALLAYQDIEIRNNLRYAGIKSDFSWMNTAVQIADIYSKTVSDQIQFNGKEYVCP